MTDAAPAPAAGRLWLGLCAASFVAASLAYGAVWEPAHDEGVTWQQAFGDLPIPSYPEPAAPIEAIYGVLDARSPHPPQQVIAQLMVRDGMHPPAYYLALNGWSRLVGTQQRVLNLPAIVAGVLTLLGMALLSRRMVPEAGMPWAAALLALSPWFVAYTNFARPYAIAICLVVWSTEMALRVAESDAPRRWPWRVGFVVLSVVGIYSIYHYVFALLWQGAFLALCAVRGGRDRSVRELLALSAMTLAVVLAYAPWLSHLAAHLQLIADKPFYFSSGTKSGPLTHAVLLFSHLGLAEEWPSRTLRVLLAALGLLTLGAAWRAFSPGALRALAPGARSAWLTLPLLPGALVAADLWSGTRTIFVSKACFAMVPLWALFIARAWSAGVRGPLGRLGLAGWLALFCLVLGLSVAERARTRTPFEVLAAHLAETDIEQHTLVLSSTERGYTVPLMRTLRDAGVRSVRVVQADQAALPRLLRDAKGDPQVGGITFANLKIFYATGDLWDASWLSRLAAAAQARGAFDAQLIDWREGPPGPPGNRRTIWITSPALQSKYFSR